MLDCCRVDKNVLGLKLDNTLAINWKRVGLGRISVIHLTDQSKHFQRRPNMSYLTLIGKTNFLARL